MVNRWPNRPQAGRYSTKVGQSFKLALTYACVPLYMEVNINILCQQKPVRQQLTTVCVAAAASPLF